MDFIDSRPSSPGISTPTHTTFSDPFEADPPPYPALISVPPTAGETFIIRDPQTGLIITLKDGHLCLLPAGQQDGETFGSSSGHPRGHWWRCVRNSGLWLGFKSAVSGGFIGHDNRQNRWRFIATAREHNWWELFCVRQDPSGGHILLVKHNNEFRAMRVGGAYDMELVVAGKGEDGTAWEFIKVGYEV
ncbi:uncharacterized protein BDV14DRAFT_106489 [Aspergillus stella-maris]|uniref:uncharacterized protein n=1 Tax=Aspergillus stella-maris TaxID=1810926 RepID=UPI003CCCBF1E